MTKTEIDILNALHEHQEIHGTEQLCLTVGVSASKKNRVVAFAVMLHRLGLIDMELSAGGRGNKTIYRNAGTLKVQQHGHHN